MYMFLSADGKNSVEVNGTPSELFTFFMKATGFLFEDDMKDYEEAPTKLRISYADFEQLFNSDPKSALELYKKYEAWQGEYDSVIMFCPVDDGTGMVMIH